MSEVKIEVIDNVVYHYRTDVDALPVCDVVKIDLISLFHNFAVRFIDVVE